MSVTARAADKRDAAKARNKARAQSSIRMKELQAYQDWLTAVTHELEFLGKNGSLNLYVVDYKSMFLNNIPPREVAANANRPLGIEDADADEEELTMIKPEPVKLLPRKSNLAVAALAAIGLGQLGNR